MFDELMGAASEGPNNEPHGIDVLKVQERLKAIETVRVRLQPV